MTSTLGLFFRRELRQQWRNLADSLQPLIFFVIVMVLFPLSIDPDKAAIKAILPACIWVAALLATLMSLDNLFRDDYADGSIEQYIISGRSLALISLVKTLTHWFSSGLLLSLIASLACLAMGFKTTDIGVLFLSLLLGTLALHCVGAVGAALTVSLRKNGILLAIIVLPLYIPILIFGAGATRQSMEGVNGIGSLYLLASLAVLALTLTPLAVSAALKNSID